MLTKAEILWPVLLKLDRADHHIDDLARAVSAFLAEEPYSLVVRQDPNLGNGALTIKEHKAVPETISLILGDALHNARSALDLLAVGLVGDRAVRPWDVQFPFTRNSLNIRSEITKRQLDLVGDEMVEKIEALEPYPGGKHGLHEVHALDISDKHKIILVGHRVAQVTGNQLGMIGLPVTGAGGLRYTGDNADIVTFRMARASLKERLACQSKLPTIDHEPPFKGEFMLCFTRSQPFGGQEIVSKAREIVTKIRSVADELASLE